MLNSLRLLVIASITLFLSACAISVQKQASSGFFAKKTITQEQLPNGTPVKVGMLRPTDAWQCDLIGTHSYDWGLIKLKTFNINSYGSLKKQVLAYAGQKNLKPNYIFIELPDQITVNGLNPTAMAAADAYYYQCKYINP